ncbi:iron complex transport system substrate-binding protein [Natranaerovirga hydrolytica]|uniref:Iron complex transport system substrate-binding protein n=1 Tax=Natranaerovirga hydrolytica TaxID=680378 RepID=A0A4R1MKQ9_9FIRM|nr:iron-siderophore ABC transporter substrate-binding protein [Natranaerovirga hydrolytica]TCK92412.1 iron complex transport system substrate-binding protein [Natranaerovirga hydrolytica]
MKKLLVFISILALTLGLVACGGSNDEPEVTSNPVEGASSDNESTEDEEPDTRTIEHAMGVSEVPVNPERIVVLNGDGLEAILSVGVTPIGSTQAMGERQWYEHLEDYMDGVTNVGTMTEPDLEAIMQLEPDLILGVKSRQEESYDLLSAIAPTVFTETHTLGGWKEDFKLYVDAINKSEEGAEVLAAWEERASELSAKLEAAGVLDQEVSIVRFTAGQGRFFYNNSYSGSIMKELGFARPENHDVDDLWMESITQERIPEMDSDVMFYFVLDQGDGEAIQFSDEWMSTVLFQNLRAAQNEQVYEVDDAYWNMTYGILSADYVLEDIERLMLD